MSSSPVWRDQIWSDGASYILAHHQPNLMMVHLLNEDAINYRYGPDHGFETVKRTIRLNVVLKEHGLVKMQDGKVRCDAYAVTEGGTAMVYLTNPKADRARLIARLQEIFLATERVDRIVLLAEYHQLGMPMPEENRQMADLVVTAKVGYAFWPPDTDGPPVADVTEKGLRGHHAYMNDNPKMNSIFIAAGYGIRKGARLPVVDSKVARGGQRGRGAHNCRAAGATDERRGRQVPRARARASSAGDALGRHRGPR
jgi:predicted AlkP superfamily pyrophosphatase or phosphodiesterase